VRTRVVTIESGPPCSRTFGAGDAVVVVDVIRATTTAITGVALGRRVFPAPSLAAARAVAAELCDPLLVGEHDGARATGCTLTNSPAQLAQRSDRRRPMVLISSSGTPLLHEVRHAGAVFLACLRNARATARALAARHDRITLIGAATHGAFREEDQLCCARIAESLLTAGFTVGDEQTRAVVDRWSGAPPEALLTSASVAYLRATDQLADLEFILRHVDDLSTAFALARGEVVVLPTVAPHTQLAVRGGH